MDNFVFQSSEGLLRAVILLVGSYIGLMVVLRLSGKRTLSKMNAFDLVVTVALGSTLATISLSKDTALLQGLIVLAGLVLLQFIVAWLSVRSSFVRRAVKAEPTLLFHDGEFRDDALKRERVAKDEVLATVRSHGIADLSRVMAVVLETDGSFSVISGELGKRPSLQDVSGFNGQHAQSKRSLSP